MIKKINNLKYELNEIEQKIIKLENSIEDKTKLINNIETIELKNYLNKNSFIELGEIKNLINKFKLNEKNINEIKLNDPSSFKPEQMMSVIFMSYDENIHYSVVCKKTDIFSKIESLFYDKYPEYNSLNNNFIINGNIIDKSKSLEENNIQNSDIIMINNIKNK